MSPADENEDNKLSFWQILSVIALAIGGCSFIVVAVHGIYQTILENNNDNKMLALYIQTESEHISVDGWSTQRQHQLAVLDSFVNAVLVGEANGKYRCELSRRFQSLDAPFLKQLNCDLVVSRGSPVPAQHDVKCPCHQQPPGSRATPSTGN
jgi:hypothetical protein